ADIGCPRIEIGLEAGPEAAAGLDDLAAQGTPPEAELERLLAASAAQMRFDRGHDTLTQRAAERHFADDARRVEVRAAHARDDPLAVALDPILTRPNVTREPASRREAIPLLLRRLDQASHGGRNLACASAPGKRRPKQA